MADQKLPVEKIIHYDKDTKQLVLQNLKSKKIRVYTIQSGVKWRS